MFSRKKARNQAEDLQETARELSQDACSHLRQAAGHSCHWVKQNPWAGVGVGAAIGFIAGFWLTSNKGE